MASALTVPASPKLYTTNYAVLKGIDLMNAPTETSRNHAADMVNIMPDPDGGFPCKRIGWRYVHDFREETEGTTLNTKVLAAYHDVDNNCDLIATEKKLWHYDCETEVWTLIRQSLTVSPNAVITKYVDRVYISMFSTLFFMTDDNLTSPAEGGYTEICLTPSLRLTELYAEWNAALIAENEELAAALEEQIDQIKQNRDSGDMHIGYVPRTVISKNPDGSGGTALEGVNLLCTERIEQFLSDQIPTSETDASLEWYIVSPNVTTDRIIQIRDVQFMSDEGVWESGEAVADVDNVNPNAWHWRMYQIVTRTINKRVYSNAEGTETMTIAQNHIGIKFNSRSGARLKQKVLGQDSVRIIYEEFDSRKKGNTYYGRYKPERLALIRSNVVAKYGNISMDRFFYAIGNKIYYTEPERPWYIPDDNYLTIGNGVPIVGLHKYNYALAAITRSTAEHTVFMIQEQVQEVAKTVYDASGAVSSASDTIYYFQVRPTTSGTGAIAPRSFGTLIDDPLFLASSGIYAISTQTYTSSAIIANRSKMINPWLVQERNMDKAACAIWNSMYLLALNNHVYVLDSNNRIRTNSYTGYECYYWDNVPATIFLSYDGNLFFATEEGRWCRFNTDLAASVAYSDGGTWDSEAEEMSNGEAIRARYALSIDHDGLPQYFKKLQKKGFAIVIYPYGKAGAKIYYEKDGAGEQLVADVNASITTFDNVDFEDFSFETTDTARIIYPKKKVKKYKTLQLIVENDQIDEQFGLISVTKTYTVQNFAKGGL